MRWQHENGIIKPGPAQLSPDTTLQAKLRRWSYYLAAAALAIAVFTLAGWQFDLRLLRGPLESLATMNPLTAVLVILSSISFLLFSRSDKKKYRAATALAALVIALAFIKIVSLALNTGWEIDQLLYPRKLKSDIDHYVASKMAPNTAFCFLLTGVALLIYMRGWKRVIVAQAFALVVALAGWLSLLGHMYRVETFYSVLNYLPMTLPSAISFLFLSLAILFSRPAEGMMRQLTSQYSGSTMAKLLIPAAVLIPTVLGLARLKGHWAGFYDTESGVAMYTLAIIIIFLALTWYITTVLNNRDVLKKSTEDATRGHEAQIAAIFKAAPDAIIVIDHQSQIREWNKEAETLFGWTVEEVIGKKLTDTIIPEELREGHSKAISRYLSTGTDTILGKTIELKAVTKNGDQLDIALRVAQVPVREMQLFVGFARDITQEKRTAQKLKSFNEELARRVAEKTKEIAEVLERLNDGFIALDRDFCYTYMNKKAGEMSHTDPLSVIGKNIWEVFPDAIGSPTYMAICQAMSDQQYTTNTDYFEPLQLWQENYIYPSTNGVSIFIKDITERKKAELEVNEAHKLADKLIDSLPGVFYFYDETGKFIRWNTRFEEVTGYSSEEISRMHPNDFFPENEREYIAKRIEGVFEKGVNDAEAHFQTRKGELLPYYFRAVLITYEGGPCLLGFGIDITERKKSEEELKSSEQKYKLLFESNPLPMWMLSLPDYKMIDVNNSALEQYGYTREEFLQLDVTDLRPEEDKLMFKDKTDTSFRHIHHAGIWRHQRKDGSILYVDIVTYDLYTQGKPARFVLANNVTEKYIAEEKLKASYESIRELTEHLQKVREEERTHIAREIHDELGQQLTVLKMDLSWLNKKIEARDEAMTEKINGLFSMVDATVKTVRRIASELRPSLLDDLGLVAAMEWHVHEFTKRSGVNTEFQGPDTDMKLPDDVKIGLFRILQESLTNVARHAKATAARVVFEQTEKELILTITDNGVGFVKESANKKTLGILGMKERASMLGGEYTMTGEAGKGTTISVVIPLKNIGSLT